jgi:hypothetical protein
MLKRELRKEIPLIYSDQAVMIIDNRRSGDMEVSC